MKTKYCVIRSAQTDYLESMVESALDSGWKLQGGVSVTLSIDDTIYAQAMVKEEADPKEEVSQETES